MFCCEEHLHQPAGQIIKPESLISLKQLTLDTNTAENNKNQLKLFFNSIFSLIVLSSFITTDHFGLTTFICCVLLKLACVVVLMQTESFDQVQNYFFRCLKMILSSTPHREMQNNVADIIEKEVKQIEIQIDEYLNAAPPAQEQLGQFPLTASYEKQSAHQNARNQVSWEKNKQKTTLWQITAATPLNELLCCKENAVKSVKNEMLYCSLDFWSFILFSFYLLCL